jgi:hypothetical protein
VPSNPISGIALKLALDEANAGLSPEQQTRDPRRLVRIVCAWYGRLIRYEIWPEAQPGGVGGNVSHGICPECARKVEASMGLGGR